MISFAFILSGRGGQLVPFVGRAAMPRENLPLAERADYSVHKKTRRSADAERRAV